MNRKAGAISQKVIDCLGLCVNENTPIYIGDANIQHMKSKHPKDYGAYKGYITDILNNPDYVGQNPADQSIEYVKEFCINGEYVKVAVRVTGGGHYFVRTMYVLNENRVRNYIRKGSLHKL